MPAKIKKGWKSVLLVQPFLLVNERYQLRLPEY